MKSNFKIAKKAQYAVPIILVGMAALLLIYLIMVYPEERAKMLGIEMLNKTSGVTTSPLGGDTKLIFSSGEISEIGRSSGESVFKFDMNDVYVAYPAVEKALDMREITLKANALKSDSSLFGANNINIENTKEVIIMLNITEVKGSPTLIILLNDSKIFERTAQVGEINVRIPQALLKEENPIQLKLEHSGAFWTSQYAVINVEIVQVFYNPENPIAQQVVTLGQSNMQGNELRLSFKPAKAITDGELIVKINGKIIFSGTVNENQIFSISKRLDDSGIQIGENAFEFEADKGGVYNITDVKLEFVAVATPSTVKIYSFDIPQEDLESPRKIVLGLKIDKVIKPGFVYAQIGSGGPLYYFDNADIASGAWSYTELDKEYLQELGNKIIVNSPNGRYRVTGLVIILV